MQIQRETYHQRRPWTFCDNATRRGRGVEVYPRCTDGHREYLCTVAYNDVEQDTMVLCRTCRDHLRRDARRHGYQFHSKKLATTKPKRRSDALACLVTVGCLAFLAFFLLHNIAILF